MRYRILAAVCVLAVASGCNILPSRSEVRYSNPELTMSMTRNELVDYLNSTSQGVGAWRDIDTTLGVHLPNGLYQRLSGTIACQAPNRFRLTAENFMAKADFGSNSDRCWVYVKPGDRAVLTWKHEDAPLLQHMPVEIPRIDPEWLMTVLGVAPLNHEEYELAQSPVGSRELWLTAIEDSYTGRPLRRVIKVDSVHGVIREHAIYDSERNPLVRAILSRHESTNGHVLPQQVELLFPQLDTKMKLSFSRIDTNCELPEHLFAVPRIPDTQIVDLGVMMKRQVSHNMLPPQRPQEKPQVFVEVAGAHRTPHINLSQPSFDNPIPEKFSAWRSEDERAREFVVYEDRSPVTRVGWEVPATEDAEEPEWDDEPTFYSE